MPGALAQLASDHAAGFVAAAAVICLVAGGLLGMLLQHAERARRAVLPWWLAGVALVAGVGVWTTHFMAMLGYRSDLALGYSPAVTAASALIAAVAVGAPLAASAVLRGAWPRAAAGAVSGLGVGAMHLTGMAALEGCVQAQSAGASVLACLVGASFMALARGSSRARGSIALTCLLIAAAVCGAHFTAIAGTSLAPASAAAGGSHGALSLFTAVGAMVLFLATILAIFAARRFDAQEAAHSAVLATALHNMSNGILTVSADDRIELFNERLREMLGLAPGDVLRGMALDTFLANVARAGGRDDGWAARALANHHRWMATSTETQIEQNFDDGRVLAITCRPVSGGAVLTFDDVTSDRHAKRQIMDLAFKDPLTGLANRRAFGMRVEEAFAAGERFSMLLVDLDRFKQVNDTYGHGTGDLLLVAVAGRVRAVAGAGAVVARLGGDEMAVLLPGGPEVSREVAKALVAALGEAFVVGEITIVIGGSVGTCSSGDAANAAELMQRADLALYESKRCGRGRAVEYRPGLLEAVSQRRQLEADLGRAIEKGEFHLVYQPVCSLAPDPFGTGSPSGERTIGYEALIRWKHPARGSIPPMEFIPLAEETGQIVAIGRWVLEEACRTAAAWDGDQHIAVNVSPVQLRSPLFLSHVVSALDRSGLPARRLEIELTETAMVEDGEQIAHVLQSLRALGVRVAMDDFGTGYSSLAHLRDLPLDRIKIDRSFVAAAETDGHCMAVLKAVTQMGRDMQIPTLAEGVETQSQMQILRALGCDAAQGYLIGRPGHLDAPDAAPLTASA